MTIVCGAGVLLVFLILFVFREDLLVQYHLSQLKRSSTYLAEIVDSKAGSAGDIAISKFLESDEGQEALFSLYLRSHKRFLTVAIDVSNDNPSGIQNLKEAVVAAHGNDFVCRYLRF